jgi:hypothetical protein
MCNFLGYLYIGFFLALCIISIVFSMLPYEWPVFIMCCAYEDVSLSYFIARMCFLYRARNGRPVCPIYCRGQSMDFKTCMSLLSYLLLLRCFGSVL